VIEAKANERNVHVSLPSTRPSGSYVTMRVPGTNTKLTTLEITNTASSLELKNLDDSSWWLTKFA